MSKAPKSSSCAATPPWEFAAGMIGVFRRRRRRPGPRGGLVADDAWFGARTRLVGRAFRNRVRPAEALVRAAARRPSRESGVLFAGTADDPDGIVRDARCTATSARCSEDRSLSFGDFCVARDSVLCADLLRPWSNWGHAERRAHPSLRHLFLRRRTPARPARRRGENTESDQVGWARLETAIDDFAEGRALLLLPTWSQLDSADRPHRVRRPALERRIDKVQPKPTVVKDNQRSSSSTPTATTTPAAELARIKDRGSNA